MGKKRGEGEKKKGGKEVIIGCLVLVLMFVCISEGKGVEISKEEKERVIEETKVVVAVISWAEGVDGRTEEALWRLSAHPSIEGLIKIDLCSLHRARNSVIESVLVEMEKLLESNSTLTLTHLLLVHQNVVFKIEDVEELIYAQKEVIGGLSLTKLPPFLPSFIPLKKDVNFCEISPTNYFSTTAFPPMEEGASAILEVEAMSHSFSLLKLSALKKARRSFAERGEWFYTSHFDDFFGSINCYPSLKCPSSSSSSPHNDWMRLMMDQMEEEDFCFARQLRKFGIKQHLLSSLHIATSHSSLIAYSPTQHVKTITKTNDDVAKDDWMNNVKVEFERGEGVIVDNRMKEKKEGRRFVYPSFPSQSARVVIATPIWHMINSETLHKLYILSQDINIIGRVAVHHENVVIARNKLLRAIEEEFKGEYQYTHVLFIDSDMSFSVNDFETLLRLDKDISMGLAVRRGKYGNPPAYIPLSGNVTDHSPLLKALALEGPSAIPVKAGGMAFTLIKRKVINNLRETLPNGDEEWFWTEHYVDEDSGQEHHFSEDYSFCKRAREFGHEIYIETTVQLGHIDRTSISIRDWLSQIGVNFTPFSQLSPSPTASKLPNPKLPPNPNSNSKPNPNPNPNSNSNVPPTGNAPQGSSASGSGVKKEQKNSNSEAEKERPFNPTVPRGVPLTELLKEKKGTEEKKESGRGERLPFTTLKDIPIDTPKPVEPSPTPQFHYSPLQPQII